MSDDYLLKVKVQNNKIISLMKSKGYQTVAELSRACGIHQSELGKYINMTKSPILTTNYNHEEFTDKPWTLQVLKLADFFGVLPDEMFNEQQIYHELKTNRSETAISRDSLQSFMTQLEAPEPEQLYLENQTNTLLMEAIAKLSPRSQKIITMKFGLDGEDPKTLDEIGKECGILRERARQIIVESLRELRHPELGLRDFEKQSDDK